LYFPSARYFFNSEQEGGRIKTREESKGTFYFSGPTDKKSLINGQKTLQRIKKNPPKSEVGGAPRGEAPDIDTKAQMTHVWFSVWEILSLILFGYVYQEALAE